MEQLEADIAFSGDRKERGGGRFVQRNSGCGETDGYSKRLPLINEELEEKQCAGLS